MNILIKLEDHCLDSNSACSKEENNDSQMELNYIVIRRKSLIFFVDLTVTW